jgi:hypothetical protein
MSFTVHEKLVHEFASLPPRRHEWSEIEKFTNGKSRSFLQKTKSFFENSGRIPVTDTFDAIVRFVNGTRVLEENIRASKLSNRIATHFLLTLRELERAGINYRTFKTSSMTRFVDLGRGNVIEFGVRLHDVGNMNRETRGSIVATAKSAKEFDREMIDFDLVPVEPYAEEPTVLSASLRRVKQRSTK